jgi:amidophosphoribosyltransferase
MTSQHGVDFAFAFNGNLRNYEQLKREVDNHHQLETDCDGELLAYLLGRNLGTTPFEELYAKTAHRLDGSYSAVMLIAGDHQRVVAFRDPLGIRPLCVGRRGDDYFVASESVAFANPYLGAEFLRDVAPGEVVSLDDEGLRSQQVFDYPRHAHCMFEWVYFARMDSVMEGIPIHDVRERLGASLATRSGVDADMVVPVPDSGRSAAIGYAMETSVPLRECFQVDRYIYRRVFIMPSQGMRVKLASKKQNVIPSVVQGKRIVVVDDSIVRGTNMRNMVVGNLKTAGATEIHVRISCPPLVDRCPFGVDFHRGELIASKHFGLPHEELCRNVGDELGVDSLYYNTIPDLVAAIGLPEDQICTGCLMSSYPHVDWSQIDGE